MVKKAKGEGMEQEKKERIITEATPEALAKVLETEFKKGKLKLVVGRQTGVPAIIYKKKFKKETQTGIVNDKKLMPKAFIRICQEQGFVVATDGKYVRIWTSGYFVEKTGLKTKAKPRTRENPTFEQLREQASKMHLRKYTKKKDKKSLAASIRRALKKKGKKKLKHNGGLKEEAPVEKKHSEEPKGEAPAEESSKKIHKKHLEVEEPSKGHKKHHLKERSPEERFTRLKMAAKEKATEDIEAEATEDVGD